MGAGTPGGLPNMPTPAGGLPRWGNKLPRSKTKPSLSRPNRSPLVTSPGNRLSPDSASRWWLHDLHQFIRNIRATRTSFAKWTHENDSGPNGSVSKACFEDRVHLDTAICTPVLEADWKCGARLPPPRYPSPCWTKVMQFYRATGNLGS